MRCWRLLDVFAYMGNVWQVRCVCKCGSTVSGAVASSIPARGPQTLHGKHDARVPDGATSRGCQHLRVVSYSVLAS